MAITCWGFLTVTRMADMNENRTWMDVEMDETMELLRKKLEELNDIHVDDLEHEDVECLEKIYKTIYYIKQIRKL